MDIDTRRADLERELVEARLQRGAAVLDGAAVDAARIAQLEADIEALTDAENARVRRARAEAEAVRQARLAQLRGELAAMEADRLQALGAAEHAARELAAQLGAVLKVTERMARTCHLISGENTPIPLSSFNAASRLGGRLSAIMSTIPGYRARLGSVEWRVAIYGAEDDWAAAEAKLLKGHLEPLTGGRKANGHGEN
jgi:hypothetical protein